MPETHESSARHAAPTPVLPETGEDAPESSGVVGATGHAGGARGDAAPTDGTAPSEPADADDAVSSESAQDAMAADAGVGDTADIGGVRIDNRAPAEVLAMAQTRRRTRRQRRTRALVGVGAALCALLALVLGTYAKKQLDAFMAAQQEARRPAPSVVTAELRDFTSTVSAMGTIVAGSTADVASEVDGTVAEVRVTEGQDVTEGDVLFVLKNDNLDAAVGRAEAQLGAAKSALAEAQGKYQAAQQAWDAALAADKARAEAQASGVGVGGAAGISATAGLVDPSSLASAVEAAETAVQGAQGSYESAVAQADGRTITAPASGTITRLFVKEGTAVVGTSSSDAELRATAGAVSQLAQISDLSTLRAEVRVSQDDIGQLGLNQTAALSFPQITDVSAQATVSHVDSAPIAKEGDAQGASYVVTLLLSSPDPAIRLGWVVTATITTKVVPSAVVIPLAAITTDASKTSYVEVVTLASNGKDLASRERRQVTILARDGESAAVQGVNAGDELLIGTGEGDDAH
ncbi:efflux RND transporter periplasmic adaptor subunit [Olsenella sp. HMSC062G07]|uniref:efflux RND transporter periplasmic adaptor subunit n=1 Tax=Olsenella sp. HMSC062G07 TaxID=1739330 RepID=UPI0008A1382D|nr:biotin/lipoyl-binding protein [Olsenella sp. HMSC062G07]OFK23552.1 hypothetical protein HMPREF2826_04605 [Olsenella sp. HMSC062G07]